MSYISSILPIEGPGFWPNVEYLLTPTPIKVGPSKPRKNKRKDPMKALKKGEIIQTWNENNMFYLQSQGAQ